MKNIFNPEKRGLHSNTWDVDDDGSYSAPHYLFTKCVYDNQISHDDFVSAEKYNQDEGKCNWTDIWLFMYIYVMYFERLVCVMYFATYWIAFFQFVCLLVVIDAPEFTTFLFIFSLAIYLQCLHI